MGGSTITIDGTDGGTMHGGVGVMATDVLPLRKASDAETDETST